jgi:hypothetical protein
MRHILKKEILRISPGTDGHSRNRDGLGWNAKSWDEMKRTKMKIKMAKIYRPTYHAPKFTRFRHIHACKDKHSLGVEGIPVAINMECCKSHFQWFPSSIIIRCRVEDKQFETTSACICQKEPVSYINRIMKIQKQKRYICNQRKFREISVIPMKVPSELARVAGQTGKSVPGNIEFLKPNYPQPEVSRPQGALRSGAGRNWKHWDWGVWVTGQVLDPRTRITSGILRSAIRSVYLWTTNKEWAYLHQSWSQDIVHIESKQAHLLCMPPCKWCWSGCARCRCRARSSMLFCSSMPANGIGMAAPRLLLMCLRCSYCV